MLRLDCATPADLALCRQMIRQGSKSFHLASLLLPEIYRQHARGLYGFCRMADDLVDQAADPAAAVDILSARLERIYDGKPENYPTDRAFADIVHHFAIPRTIPLALIEGFAWDATGKRYETCSDVIDYGVRVAGTVGVMMALIMGRRSDAALARAIDLGVAMQLSNIARDVEEDAALGRVYLPADWLAASGCIPEQVLSHPGLGTAAAGQLVFQAELLYDRAAGGIAQLPASCRASINAARLLYREIGLEAKRQAHRGRAFVPTRRKLELVLKAAIAAPFLTNDGQADCLPQGKFILEDVRETIPPHNPYKGLKGRLEWTLQMFLSVEGRRS